VICGNPLNPLFWWRQALQPLSYMERNIFLAVWREIMSNLGQCSAYLTL